MADSALDLSLTPRVGDKVEAEEQNAIPASVESKVIEESEILNVKQPIDLQEASGEPKPENGTAEDEATESQHEDGAPKESQHESDGIKENDTEPRHENEVPEADVKEPEKAVDESVAVNEKAESDKHSETEEENGSDGDSESDSDEYTTGESGSSESQSDGSESEGEESEEEGEDIDQEEDVVVEEEEVEEDKTEEEKQENKWVEEERKTHSKEQEDKQVIEEEGSNPAFIPRRDAFWGHDDRWSDMPDEDRYKMI